MIHRVIQPRSIPAGDYDAVVRSALVPRFRIVTLFGAFLYLLFSFLDAAVYPELQSPFLILRCVVSAGLLLGYGVSYIRSLQARLLWFADAVIFLAGVGICAMILVTEGVQSGYFQGLNLVFLAMFTINSFRYSHNLGTGLAVLGVYVGAIFLNDTPVTLATLAPPLFFMGSTLAFTVIMTRLYGQQHFSEYVKGRELAVSASNLSEALSRLKTTERLKDNFVANVSHELRTPLSLILGPVRNLLSGTSAAPDRDLKVIEQNASLLLKHVNDLLDISKLDAGRMQMDYQKVDLAELVRFTASHFEVQARDRDVRFVVLAPPTLVVEMDRAKGERVLFNLLSNAFKFTPRGGAVECKLTAEEGQVHIEVRDTGPGVPPKMRELIFDRFRQGELGDTRRHGGTGLGLAIAREFVDLHRGTITVGAAEPGAVFAVTFPQTAPEGATVSEGEEAGELVPDYRSVAEAESTFTPPVPKPGEALPLSAPVGKPVLVVIEDNPAMNEFIAEALAREGEVFRAWDGKSGWELIQRLRPDLIVTDIMMPEMSGEQVLKRIRETSALDPVPVIVLTAKADDALKDALLSQGAQDYLSKPFSATELLARARNLIAIKQVRELLEQEVKHQAADLVAMARSLADSRRDAEQSLQVAESAARAKDEFLMTLSHELRTPLTAILGWAELIHQGDAEVDEVREGFSSITRNARALLRLVNDLLDMSRVVQGKLTLQLKPQRISKVVAAAVQAVSAAAKVKGISLTVDDTASDARVRVDFDRLQQVVWNLLTNAIKFTPTGGRIEVHLSVEATQAVVRVSDTGEGIEAEFLPHVFTRLLQADSSTTRRHGGLGLGLAISRHLVELQGGSISADSPGKGAGATFTISLPLCAEERARGAASVSSETVAGSLGGVRILVVDDEPDSIQLVRTILKRQGAEVLSASSATEALETFDRERVDVLISDISMPNHDGMWLFRQLRAGEPDRGTAVPAIALTAHVEEHVRREALELGFERYLPKPVVARDLLGAVGELVSRQVH